MTQAGSGSWRLYTPDDVDTLARHRAIWGRRPELREVYQEWFKRLLAEVAELEPTVEVGSGPGFFKEFEPRLISTDVVPGDRIDVRCDASALPFRAGSVGALVMVDALHHLSRPIHFLHEAARILRPGGRVAMLEPWITPMSYFLYRCVHHEECRLRVDLADPFSSAAKAALTGNAAIPFLVIRRLRRSGAPLRVRTADAFVGLPYLVTLGFRSSRPTPTAVVRAARRVEAWLRPFGRVLATRALIVLERTVNG